MNRPGVVFPILGVVALLGLACPVFAQNSELLVSAAASLTDILKELNPEAEKYVDARILLNFGGSGTLRKQIEEGAPADVFFSAAAVDMDTLENKGLLAGSSRRNLLSNAMVLISGGDEKPVANAEGLRPLLSAARLLAIGNPDSVPAGRYAVQALKTYDLYLLVEKKLVMGGTVREVLQYVETGSAPLGIVFLTDAVSVKPGSPVKRLFLFPKEALSSPVLYPAAVVRASKNQEKAARYIEFLQKAAAKEAFRKAGFITE